MGLFDKILSSTGGDKKKKKQEKLPSYDPTNITIRDLKKGFMLDYNLETWQVLEEYEYDWGDQFYSYGYKLSTGTEECFMTISEDGGKLEITVMKTLRLHLLGDAFNNHMRSNQKPPSKVDYEGVTYYRENESPGYFRNVEKQSASRSVEFIAWDYFDDSGVKVLSVEQWGQDEFEASVGVVAEEFEVSNILPAM